MVEEACDVTTEEANELVLIDEPASSDPKGEVTEEPSSASVDLALVTADEAPRPDGDEPGEWREAVELLEESSRTF